MLSKNVIVWLNMNHEEEGKPHVFTDPGKDVSEHNTIPWTTNTLNISSTSSSSSSQLFHNIHLLTHSPHHTDRWDTTASITCTFDSPLSVEVKELTHSVAPVHYSPALEYVVVFSREGSTQKMLRLTSVRADGWTPVSRLHVCASENPNVLQFWWTSTHSSTCRFL